jgi:hypothetical protein
MANRYTTPIMFAFDKDMTFVTLRAVFGASGTVVVDAINSKGISYMAPDQVSFNTNTVASSATTSSVTSFSGLFNGMTVTGLTSTIGANITISSMTAGTGAIVLSSGTNVTTQQANNLIATGGRYRVQFGLTVGNRFDTYNALTHFSYDFREVTGSASGSSASLQLYPVAEEGFIVQNNVGVRTIPSTTTSGSTDASIAVQFGYYGASGNSFTAVVPQPGEVVHMYFVFRNSTAI